MKLGHVHLKVSGISAAEKFYCDVIGLSVKERINDYFVFLSFGEAHHDLALQEIGVGDTEQHPMGEMTPGLYHSAFEVDSARELLECVQKLSKQRVGFSMVDHQISWAVYTNDPSGNGVEIFLDRRGAPGGSESWNGRSRHLDIATLSREASVQPS